MQTISPQQILVPKKVYIGDAAELRCSFNSPNLTLKNLVKNGTVELPLLNFENTEDYDIKSITLSPAGIDFYQLTITFIPWKTGDLQFPSMAIEDTDLILELKPVQIVSLISTEGNNTAYLRDTKAPLLLPGTTYKLYGTLSIFIVALIILIRIIVKRKSLMFYINNKRLLKKYKKNKKQTIKLLKLLSKKTEENDKYDSEMIQKIMRNYLEIRFNYPFTKTVTSEIMKGWQTATGNILSEKKEEAFCDIASVFIRTDYIRYSKNGSFSIGEKKELIEKLINQIEILEKQEESEGEKNA